MDIATRIAAFINAKTKRTLYLLHHDIKKGLPYADTVKNIKWATRAMNTAEVDRKRKSLIISEDPGKVQNELLPRSVVESLSEEVAHVQLTGTCRSANSSWKHHHGVNTKLGVNQFLLEFPTKTAADRIVKEEWSWKSHKFHFDWWSSLVNIKFHLDKSKGGLDQTHRASTSVLAS